jgi:hypothetical protein
MFRSSKLTLAMVSSLCCHAYGQTPAVLFAGTPVQVRLVHPISIAMLQVGQDVDFQVTDPVWIGNAIAIPQDAFVSGQIADIHKLLFHPIQLEIRFLYVRAASGDRVPIRGGQLQANWKVGLLHGVLPVGTETTAYVSRDIEVGVVASTESTRPAGIDHAPVRWSVSR